MNNNQLDMVLEYLNTGNSDGIEIVEEGKIFDKIKGLVHDIIRKKSNKPQKASSFFGSKKLPKGTTSKKEEIEQVKDIVFKQASSSDLDRFYKNNDYCIECLDMSTASKEALIGFWSKLKMEGWNIPEKVEIWICDGKLMNSKYDLGGDNAYSDDVHFSFFPLEYGKQHGEYNCQGLKSRLGARYFNDVVDNNEYREYLAKRHEYSEQIKWLCDACGYRDK
jgi:hypothetical protein